MDISNNAFQSAAPALTLSSDTMDHAKLVMACRFGWNPQPLDSVTPQQPSQATSMPSSKSNIRSNNTRNLRFVSCRGRLYHQLSCSHRIRTDMVEDCGENCLEPLTATPGTAFYCDICVSEQGQKIWVEREAQHNAQYPPVHQMTKDQYDQWYIEHRRLEAEFERDRDIYEMELRASTRSSNTCLQLELTQDEMDFTSELDSLSIAMSSGEASTSHNQSRNNRISLPTDSSEQLHWSLNTLSLDRGSCAVEYTGNNQTQVQSPGTAMNKDELWARPRD